MSDLYWIVERLVEGELTSEAHIDFRDKASDLTYQQGSVSVPKRPTAEEIAIFVNRRRAQLEAESVQAASTPVEVTEVPVPDEIAGKSFDGDGEVKARV